MVKFKAYLIILGRTSLHCLDGHRSVYWPFRLLGNTDGRQKSFDKTTLFLNTDGLFSIPDEESLNLFSEISNTFG